MIWDFRYRYLSWNSNFQTKQFFIIVVFIFLNLHKNYIMAANTDEEMKGKCQDENQGDGNPCDEKSSDDSKSTGLLSTGPGKIDSCLQDRDVTGDSEQPDDGSDLNFMEYRTLQEFGYIFNDEGHLTSKETGEPFNFKISKRNEVNQRHYEHLGEIITENVYELLETMANLKKIIINDRGFFFMSEDAMAQEKLMVLIHGSGVVRAGQWARSLIINHGLKEGTQLEYIKRAQEEGYGVIVLNTNQYKDIHGPKPDGCKSEKNHAEYVWRKYVDNAKAKHIAIVAHSFGGVVTVDLGKAFREAFMERVFAIAFTDSVHSFGRAMDHGVKDFFLQNAQNWVTSSDPLDTPQEQWPGHVHQVSAGHTEHVWTSHACFESVFKFFTVKLAEKINPPDRANPDLDGRDHKK